MIPLVLPFPEIDPALFTLQLGSFQFSLRWYALAYIAGLVIGWRMLVWLMRRPRLWPADKAPMTPDQPEELLTWMTLGVVLGGRLGFVAFYNPAYYIDHPGEILRVWEGGMSFHGGFIGVILATIIYTRIKGMPLMQVGDAVALAAPAGLLLGRLANFINGELWGRVSDVPWAMVFPTVPERFWVDGINLPRHPSQLYEAFLEGLLLLVVMWWLALARGWLKRPGALIGVFFLGYGLARSTVENFRQWDEQLGYVIEIGSGGLTMGQMLSLPMVAIGVLWIWWARRTTPA